jgi:hypothetical protein
MDRVTPVGTSVQDETESTREAAFVAIEGQTPEPRFKRKAILAALLRRKTMPNFGSRASQVLLVLDND